MHLSDLSQTGHTPHTPESVRPLTDACQPPNLFPILTQSDDGSVRCWPLRSGLDLMVHDLEFPERTVVQRASTDDPTRLGLSFCLSGHLMCAVGDESTQKLELRAGQMSLGVTSGTKRVIEYAARQQVMLVHLHIQPQAIRLFDLEPFEQLPVALKRAIEGGTQSPYFSTHPITKVMEATLRQLLNYPYQGLAQRLYMESKALELISLCFNQILPDSSPAPASNLQEDEMNRLVYAKEILLSRAANPPTLMELAHQIGLNDRKLKQGFRQVFGTTVFGYLHRYRMQQAQQLLLMPEATIASVAQIVGYRSPEAFSVAFRRTFEVSPKAYQLAHSRKRKKSA